jgi:lipoprotein NlpD
LTRIPHIVALAVLLLITACGPKTRWDHTPREEHIVRTGETLFSIAWRYGEDSRDLARWNKLGDGSLIYPGQVIRLMPPPGERRASSAPGRKSATNRPLPPIPTQPPPPWSWPVTGRVAVEFGKRPGTGTGILIDGKAGQPVKAAASGTVAYSGSGLIGYGELIIVKHNDTYLSAYGHNASLLVTEGQTVKKGQKIATMGEGPGGKPRLHFEIRRNGKPVNPRQYLPAR